MQLDFLRSTSAICLLHFVLQSPLSAQEVSLNVPKPNFFNDPLIHVTNGIANCTVASQQEMTPSEIRNQAHYRVERGSTCYRSGRCRLPSAYLYDKEIIPRVEIAVLADGRFADTSVWAEGQRRWVWLKGCVRSAEQSQALEQLVRGIDDVEAVINELAVKVP